MTQVIDKKGDKAMPKSYNELCSRYPLKPIRTEAENEFYLDVYEKVSDLYIEHPDTEFLGDYLETLSMLIASFEEGEYPIPKTTGVDTLRFLMAQHELKQKDLVDIFKTPSILSEILNGKRQFTIDHIKQLSNRFGVSADSFLQ